MMAWNGDESKRSGIELDLGPGRSPESFEGRTHARAAQGSTATRISQPSYWTSWSILNIGRYIEMTMTPTMAPTMIIISGSMIEVSVEIAESTSSS